ncbi:MFS transporter [Helicobacter sp. 11S02629-2]|uniref:MFS transporter n=1 Tax=Helicobacter sp. 11S02629-2 TaxID=1476195 RepID=UPI000BC87EAC|nr:MFS transporter [Helicobacter sp. 11S02629-2]PAF44942.1 MFS transporter [Helicobacter sp. 11S02629-2]
MQKLTSPKKMTRQDIKTLSLSSLGGMLEFYDFIIFVFFAKVFQELFFPANLSPFWSSLNVYGAFAAGYFARPLGGIIMAHFGDKKGRKNVFMLSILLMVIPTLVLGLMPTFNLIGYAAPIVLLLIRILQGIAIGGELPGAWVFVVEHSSKHNAGTNLGLVTASVVGGILLGSIVTVIIYAAFSTEAIHSYAWRIPFILGGVFGVISIYLRRFLHETPIFKEMQKEKSLSALPLKTVFKNHKLGFVVNMAMTWLLTACVIILLLLVPNFMQDSLKIEKEITIYMQMSAIVCMCIGCVVIGYFSDKIGPITCMIIASIGLAISSYLFINAIYAPTYTLANIWTLYIILTLFSGITVLTPIIGTQCFPASVRFSGLSSSYNIAYAIFGGLTPIIASTFHKSMHSGLAIYFLVVIVIALLAMPLFIKARRKVEF